MPDVGDGAARDANYTREMVDASAGDIGIFARLHHWLAAGVSAIAGTAGVAVNPHFSRLGIGIGDVFFKLRQIGFEGLQGTRFEMKGRQNGSVQVDAEGKAHQASRSERKLHSLNYIGHVLAGACLAFRTVTVTERQRTGTLTAKKL